MEKRYLIGMFIFLAISVVALLRMKPMQETVSLIDPSYFDKTEEIGAVVYRRLYDPLTREDLVIVGVSGEDPSHKGIVEGVLAAAKTENHPIQVLFKERELDTVQVPEGTEVVDIEFNSDAGELTNLIKEKLAGGKKGLIYTANVFSSHLLRGNPIARFETAWGHKVFAFSSIGIGLRMEQEFKVDPPCVGSEQDGLGTANLGCAALLRQRILYRKKLPTNRIVALMDQRGDTDYLVYVYLPTKKAALNN